ncbi:tetratricopeptide repeat-containing diguanylate cyclase [Colwellia sp. 20A7]|uniref:tetratricopeptide repeat-containing diguanylate cyclase n=1 Tax=Colwellia sp. 20A7 TaxID=2689569 RepID=UPI001F19E815|nr:tetratricopeptide repeat-containing diguanylate cyclase [Colwellia sp. 20A7]
MCFILAIILPICYNTAYSQEKTSSNSAIVKDTANLSESALLKKAKSLKYSDRKKSTTLANAALLLSQNNKNYRLSAHSHHLLGELTRDSNNIEQSIHHFLEASTIYKNINEKQHLISSSIDYANMLFIARRYDDGNTVLDELLSIAKESENNLSIALVIIAKGKGCYQRKRYNDAIEQYSQAIKYLKEDDKVVKRNLGETYKNLAQSYKRISNREQTAIFYRKALDIFTALRDKKLMARTLNTLAEAERYLENYVVALDYSLRGLEIHDQIDDPSGRAKALIGAGIIYRNIAQYEKSLAYIYDAYLYYTKIEDFSSMGKASNQMGLIYTRLKQFDQARSFYQFTIDLPEKQIESKTLASALREMAVIDLNDGKYQSANVMAKQAYKIYQKQNDKLKGSTSARIIGNIYRAQQENSKAITYYRESLALAIEADSKLYQIKAQTPLAALLRDINSDEAISLLKKSLELSTQINTKYQTLYAYRELRKLEKWRGNIAESLDYAENEIKLSKIIQDEREAEELDLAKAKLYSHKMEEELKSLKKKVRFDQLQLLKKNTEIEIAGQARIISELELTKNKYASVALASLLAICLFAVLFIYKRFIDSNRRNKELDYLAARDPLTNCYNRRILFDFMNRDFANKVRLTEYCILMVDIDHFKAVNDTYGHSTGDSVLSAVANILQNSVRQNDIVARFGGEEFCIVLPGTHQEQAMNIAETIRQKVEASSFDKISVTCSFGVTSIKFNAKAPSELIEQADLALFKSKSLGRNKVTLWDEKLNA